MGRLDIIVVHYKFGAHVSVMYQVSNCSIYLFAYVFIHCCIPSIILIWEDWIFFVVYYKFGVRANIMYQIKV